MDDDLDDYTFLEDYPRLKEIPSIVTCLRNETCRMEIHDLLANLEYEPGKESSAIILYGAPVILVFGTIGNVLSALTLFQFLRENTFYLFLFALAFSDLFVLCIGLLERWLSLVTDLTLRDTPLGCKVTTFLCYCFSFLSVWLIVSATFERFMAMYNELKSLRGRSRKRSLLVMSVIFLLSLIIPLHFLWTVDISRSNCQESPSSLNAFVWKIWPWVDVMVYFFIPFLLILTFNGLILWKIHHSKFNKLPYGNAVHRKRCFIENSRHDVEEETKFTNRRKRLLSSSSNHGQSRAAKNRVTLLLLTISVVFLLTTSPFVVTVTYLKMTSANFSDDGITRMQSVYSVFELLMYVNHSVNFYLYCLCGKKFRLRLRNLFKSRQFSIRR